MSEVGIKKYIAISLFISCGLSVIKGFKYSINYEGDEKSFPIPNDNDIFNSYIEKPAFLDAFFIINSISDILNYIVYVIICFIVDIYMIIKLRAVLEEKTKKSKTLKVSSTNSQKNQEESEEAISKAIKMVVINTAINLLFKIPISFLPILNTYAQFYRKNVMLLFEKPIFKEFYVSIINSGFYAMIEDLSDFLYCFSISIQFFIYLRFDTKFINGFNLLFPKEKKESSK